MRTVPSNQSGTTLMELMVYLAISTIVILSMTTFVTALTQTRVRTTDQQLVQTEARTVIERITLAVRNSKNIDVAGDRINLTDDSGLITSFCLCDQTIKAGQAHGHAPNESALQPIIDPSVSVGSANFEKISSSLRVRLELSKGVQTARMTSTIAYRQHP